MFAALDIGSYIATILLRCWYAQYGSRFSVSTVGVSSIPFIGSALVWYEWYALVWQTNYDYQNIETSYIGMYLLY